MIFLILGFKFDMIKNQSENLFEECKSYLYALIFNEEGVEKNGGKKIRKEGKEREKKIISQE